MTYPNLYTRLSNFLRDANNGQVSPAPAKLDAELNGIQLSLAQVITQLKAVTSADGRLKNVAQSLAAALVDTWQGPSTANPTVTTIVWDSTYSYESVMVMVGGVLLTPNGTTFTLSNSSGSLAITFATPPTVGTTVSAWAFAPGAGIVTRLAALTTGDGASMVGVQDTGNFYGASTVEGALQEVASSLVALQNNLGNVAELLLRDGSVALTGNLDADGNKFINNADGVDPGDLVTLRQIANYIAAWTDLSRFYLKRDGTAAMAGPLNFGNNKGFNLADPDLTQPLEAVNVRALQRAIATGGAAPVGTLVDYAGDTAPDNWLFCDGTAYLGTAFPILYDLLGISYKSGPAQGSVPARFAPISVANLTLGGITSLPTLTEPGNGYNAAPTITCQNPPGRPAPASPPTFNIVVSAGSLSGPTVTGGALTITLVGGGIGVEDGAVLVISNSPAFFHPLPTGYFRTPDARGRVALGAGTESRTPGLVDPPDVTKGDSYDATPHTNGQTGGEEQHRLVTGEMPYSVVVEGIGALKLPLAGATATRGGSAAHQNLPPFFVVNKIIKAA